MSKSYLSSSFVLFVAGLLLIAWSGEPSSLLAIAGFVSIALAVVAAACAVKDSRSKTAKTKDLTLDADQKEKVKAIRESEGMTVAVKKLREDIPHLSLVDAHRLVKGA